MTVPTGWQGFAGKAWDRHEIDLGLLGGTPEPESLQVGSLAAPSGLALLSPLRRAPSMRQLQREGVCFQDFKNQKQIHHFRRFPKARYLYLALGLASPFKLVGLRVDATGWMVPLQSLLHQS